ncbi:PEP/pyruvate-binding domain-containing protein, partial [Bacteroidota bacterium]
EEIISAIERYNHLVQQGLELSTSREMSFRVALIRTFLSDQPLLIDIAKQNVCVNDFNKLIRHLIFPVGGRGKLGGKGSGLFIAKQIITKSEKHNELLANIKTPKTWYISSDNILKFISYNNLEDLVEQKYKEIGQVRQEYPYVVNVFKNSSFPHEIINGLSMALDDFGDKPLVIRSSSQLEDRIGTAFAGKYKSLFIANQGTKEKRLIELMDAIAEVYASTFGPDPIDYRKEQGLLDFHEEMGIMVQEVIGKKVGPYFMPAFAGVAFSQNEFLWSARLKREDGLVRMVPGLGTRAVDRLDNDYPILVAPGSPNFPVNITTDEKIRYSPKNIDVINLKTCRFETIRIEDLLKKHGDEYPAINNIVSILEQDFIRQPGGLGVNFKKDSIVVTFEGLFEKTLFIKRIFAILNELEEKYKYPVDIEFAHDGENFYLLQCRSQSSGKISKPAAIPKNVSRDKIIFSANKYIPNGHVTDISYIVYVDPLMYSELSSHKDMVAIGRAVSRLNQILPKRKFILMGPGRWGSRGDIKLGVNVTYSDINNSSMLIEMARKQKDYVPDLSFGTHFFQDLVESNIRYLPLYPDSRDVTFNEEFFIDSDNILAKILPDYSKYKDVIHVIDVAKTANGDTFQIFMNAELSEAAGVIIKPKMATDLETDKNETSIGLKSQEVHWLWRQRNIEKLAKKIDPVRFGVKAFYLFGSTKNATAGPGSDINILIHFIGNESQRKELLTWLEGWSLSFSQINYLRTGYETDGLLDIHIVTDEDIKNRTSYAVKIGAYTDAARQLAIGKKND